ncbi:alpha/beta fold hydrolase [Spirillospora sp. CA-253888]
MRHADWGVRCPRWAGIRSRRIDVCGTDVHYLSADSGRAGPAHLLVHPMAGSASMWLDLIAPLSRLGPVVAPDLPGTMFGHTRSPHPRAPKAEPQARFLRAFTVRLSLQGTVTHGWSMGALAAVLFAEADPERVGRLVLAAPALPGPLPAHELLFWRTLGGLGLALGAPAARPVLRLTGRRLLDLKLKAATGPGRRPGGDLSRLSPDMAGLLADELRGAEPQRLGDAVTALASVMSALFVDRRPVHRAIDRVSPPALLLWGAQDGLITRSTMDDLAERRPGWRRQVFETAGHMLPLEAPDDYVRAVRRWLAER